jgi:hypothetical protein
MPNSKVVNPEEFANVMDRMMEFLFAFAIIEPSVSELSNSWAYV